MLILQILNCSQVSQVSFTQQSTIFMDNIKYAVVVQLEVYILNHHLDV